MTKGWSGTVVVTGAASGIGRALAVQAAQAGASKVVMVDRNLRALEETARLFDGEMMAQPVELDVSDGKAVAALVQQIEAQEGPIEAWFSNAGVNRGEGLGTPEDWAISLDVNLMAHVHAASALLPLMEIRRRGRFVITASAAGLLSDLRAAPYTTTKHAAVGFAEWLAIGVADGVTISCVCPEGVLTGMTRANSTRAAKGIGFLEPQNVAEMILDGAARGDFLILTHPNTAEYERRRAADHPRWLAGMRRARTRSLGLDRIFPSSAKGIPHGDTC